MTEPKRPKEVVEAQARHLKTFPACAISGLTGSVQAHHIFDFDGCEAIGLPGLASDPRNFITLAETEEGHAVPNFHLLVGHLGSFRSINFDLPAELDLYRQWWAKFSTAEVKGDSRYLTRVTKRPRPVSEWTTADIASIRARVLRMFPGADR